MLGLTEAVAVHHEDMANDHLARLLIVEDSLNEGELMIRILRHCGYAVRQTTADDFDKLISVLKTYSIDLVLCSAAPKTPALKKVRNAIQACGKDIPLIALVADHNAEKQLEIMQVGASEVVCKSHLEHLHLVIRRELASLEIRRKLQMSEQLIRESETRCRTLLDSSRDAIAYVHDGMHIHANAVYLNLFGFENLHDIEGIPVMDMVAPQDHAKLKEFLSQYRRGEEGGKELQILGLRTDGTAFNATLRFAPAAIEGEPCTQIIIRDRRADLELEKKLKLLSQLDPLTGLYNRQYFLDQVEAVLQQTVADQISEGAVLYCEPDNIGTFKEAIGLAGSDLLLSDIANVIRATLTESYQVARFGDFAFTVLAPHSNADSATALAEDIRAALENHRFEVAAKSITVTCSIGISLVTESSDAQEVLSAADQACELVKQQGGNQWRLYDPLANQKAGKHCNHYWGKLIREALNNNQFNLVYQPIASLHLDSGEKYEVLLRMKDQQGKEILPGQFIPIAKDNHLLAAIDRWVILNTVRTLRQRLRAGRDTVLFVKISEASLKDESLLPWLSRLLQKALLPNDRIVFELSEEAAWNHLTDTKMFFNSLRALRCGCSLEHFGKGYSENGKNSFELLKHLPATYIKIDSVFMHNLANNTENQAIIRSIADTAQSSAKMTIAPYVEDAGSLAILWQAGIDYLQGHFLQQPDASMNFDFEGADN